MSTVRLDRQDDKVQIIEVSTHQQLEITLLFMIPFTSKRRRMSVIIRDVDGLIKIITKGADTEMMKRTKDPLGSVTLKTTEDLNQFSIEGLRCLIVSAAVIPDNEQFRKWCEDYHAAMTDLSQLDLRKSNQPNRIDELEDIIGGLCDVRIDWLSFK